MATHSSILVWESHGQRSLVGYSPWGRKGWDTTEKLTFSLSESHARGLPGVLSLDPFPASQSTVTSWTQSFHVDPELSLPLLLGKWCQVASAWVPRASPSTPFSRMYRSGKGTWGINPLCLCRIILEICFLGSGWSGQDNLAQCHLGFCEGVGKARGTEGKCRGNKRHFLCPLAPSGGFWSRD